MSQTDGKFVFTATLDIADFNDSIKAMQDSAEAAVESIVSSLTSINENIKTMVDELQSAGQADFFQIDSVTDAIVVIGTLTTLLGSITTPMVAAETAAAALGGVITTSFASFGLAAAGVLAVVGIVSTLASAFEKEKSELDLSIEATQKAIDKHQELVDKGNELAKSASGEMSYYAGLKEELNGLVDTNGKVNEKYEDRVQFITTKLSEATGQEIKIVDGVIEGYEKLSPQIDKLIEKKRAKAILDAHEGDYTDAIINQSAALEEVTKAEESLNNEKAKKSQFVKEAIEDNAKLGLSEAESTMYAEAAWSQHLKSFEEDLSTKKNNYQAYTSTIRNYEQGYTDFLDENYAHIENTLAGNNEAYANSAEDKHQIIQGSIDDELTSLSLLNDAKGTMSEEQYQRELEQSKTELANNKEKLFALSNQVYEGTEWYQEAMAILGESGKDAYDENGNLVESVKKKLDDALLTTLEESPKYAEALKEMSENGQVIFTETGSLTPEAQKKLVEVFAAQNELAPEYANILTQMANNGQAVFDNNGDLMAAAQIKLIDTYSAMNELSPEYSNLLYDMTTKGEAVFDNNGNLTSAAVEKLTKAASSVDHNKALFTNSLKKVAKEGSDEFGKADTYSAGKGFVDGATTGAESGASGFLSAVRGLAANATSSLKNMWDMHSPSKVTKKLGQFFIEGLTIGTNEKDGEFLDSVDHLGSQAVEKIDHMAGQIQDVFSSVTLQPLFESFKGMDLQFVDDAILSEQLRMSNIVETQAKIELLKMNVVKAEQQTIEGKLDAVIENHVDLDGRELAVALAPMISEELAFNWR